MKKINNTPDLINYTHNRKADCKSTADELFMIIDNFSDQKSLSYFYKYFEKKYQLPETVVKQTVKQYLARSYILKSGKFSYKIRRKNIPKSILYYGSLIYALFFIKKNKKINNSELIIDFVTSTIEVKRWEKLLKLFNPKNILFITRDVNLKKDFPDYSFFNKKPFRDLNLRDLFTSIINEFFFGIWIVLIASFKTKVNLFPISLKIINDYLSFKSLFEYNKSHYIIQEKHYSSEPIKNYLFKKSGGIASTSIQKNIIQIDPIFFYIDLDILFSLGEAGHERLYEYGGRIGSIKPIGSLFMEHLWFDKKNEIQKKYDLAIIGINTSNAYHRLDSYDKFMDDYYSLYRWVAKLSNEHPDYNIVLIHHASAGEDNIEDEILLGSNVKVLNKNDNSYEIAFSSKFSITYGSTMGYELNAHNLPTFFIDPGYRCSFLPEIGEQYIDNMRIDSYESLKEISNNIIRKDYSYSKIINNFSNLCLDSSNVSYKLYELFNQKST